ncbi:MAG TPA: hypothetical protein VFQ76_05395 [Longimicrobiaceae bacterium]|nr:hypothetical protein [Longimicrobiaceae bacterium]
MHEEPIDLSPLHPAPARREAMVAAITARVLAEAAAVRSPLSFVAGWMRPTLAAAATVAAVSLGVLSAGEEDPAGSTAMRTVADELNFPEPVAEWIADERTPSDADLIHALEGDLP